MEIKFNLIVVNDNVISVNVAPINENVSKCYTDTLNPMLFNLLPSNLKNFNCVAI